MKLERRREIVAKAWHDFFLLGKDHVYGIDKLIYDSWLRSRQYGVDLFQEIILDDDESKQAESIKKHAKLIDIARPYMLDLYQIIKGSDFMITLTDKDGYLLETIIAPNILDNTDIDLMNLSEERVGTNAMGTCLHLGKPVQTWAMEHCYSSFHCFTTSAAPIYNYHKELIGSIGITGFANILSSHTLGMATAIAHAIENQINLAYSNIINQYISDGIIVIDREKRITSINKIALSILGLEKEELGRPLEDVVKLPLDLDYIMEENLDFYNKQFGLDGSPYSSNYQLSITNLKEDTQSQGLILLIKKVENLGSGLYRQEKNQDLFSFEDIIGESASIQEAIKLGHIAARGNSNILITGESGTGKELFAQSIHNKSSRRHKPFIAINCGALPSNLVESELFGYEEGAFTGAKKGGQAGKFELANGGTIFLDEIGEMPLSIQATLLRVIERKKLVRIGGSQEIDIDVMIIAATNKDLFQAVEDKTFRPDLFYRINVFTIPLPPLRDRKGDLEILVDYFISKYNSLFFSNVKDISEEALALVKNYSWPGNVRELENTIERAVQISQDQLIKPEDLPLYLQQAGETSPIKDQGMTMLEGKEYKAIIQALGDSSGNVKAAAQALGLSRATLYRRISKYNIDLDKYRK